MSTKTMVYIAAFIGSTIGGFVPTLWGADFLSFSSLVFSGLGGIVGVVVAIKYL